MKIGFETTPAAPAGTYSRHLAKLLAEYAPEHEYIVDAGRVMRSSTSTTASAPALPLSAACGAIPSGDDRRQPQFSALPASLFACPSGWSLLRLYRRALRAGRPGLITVSTPMPARSCRSGCGSTRRRIEVVMPLAARVPHGTACSVRSSSAVRRKYMSARRVHPHARHRRRAP